MKHHITMLPIPTNKYIHKATLSSGECAVFLAPFFLLIENGSCEITNQSGNEIQMEGKTPHAFDGEISTIARTCSFICEVRSRGQIHIIARKHGLKFYTHKKRAEIFEKPELSNIRC